MSGSGEQVRTLVRRLEEAMNARRLDALDDVLAPDFVRHFQATPDLHITSREQLTDFLRQDAAAFPDHFQTFRHVLVDGDMAAIWATYEGTQTGQLGPFRRRAGRPGSTSRASSASPTGGSPSCGSRGTT